MLKSRIKQQKKIIKSLRELKEKLSSLEDQLKALEILVVRILEDKKDKGVNTDINSWFDTSDWLWD